MFNIPTLTSDNPTLDQAFRNAVLAVNITENSKEYFIPFDASGEIIV